MSHHLLDSQSHLLLGPCIHKKSYILKNILYAPHLIMIYPIRIFLWFNRFPYDYQNIMCSKTFSNGILFVSKILFLIFSTHICTKIPAAMGNYCHSKSNYIIIEVYLSMSIFIKGPRLFSTLWKIVDYYLPKMGQYLIPRRLYWSYVYIIYSVHILL